MGPVITLGRQWLSRTTSAGLVALVISAAIAWTGAPVSAEFGGCCGRVNNCGLLLDPIQFCITDPDCGSPDDWCCWGQPHCPAIP
jgi:hypothetical protein